MCDRFCISSCHRDGSSHSVQLVVDQLHIKAADGQAAKHGRHCSGATSMRNLPEGHQAVTNNKPKIKGAIINMWREQVQAAQCQC